MAEFAKQRNKVGKIFDSCQLCCYNSCLTQKEYPLKAVREEILNAFVYRDYSIYTEGVPIRIEMYIDRMEIISSGRLYRKITNDLLGNVRPDTRNAALANMLGILHITENRYSGIPTIYREFKNAGFPAPVFQVRRGKFTVIFKDDIYKSSLFENEGGFGQDIVAFCSLPRSRDELQKFTGYSRYHTMSKLIQPLIDSGGIMMTIPDKPKNAKQWYVRMS